MPHVQYTYQTFIHNTIDLPVMDGLEFPALSDESTIRALQTALQSLFAATDDASPSRWSHEPCCVPPQMATLTPGPDGTLPAPR